VEARNFIGTNSSRYVRLLEKNFMIPVENPELYEADNIIPMEAASKLILDLKVSGKKVGLCHGGFDLLHPGHIKHFESAKKLCDVLFVSVTSNQFVTSRKGSGRPIFSDKLRAYMIANSKFVDYAIVVDFKKGVEVINILQPSFYIKGPDFINKKTPGITAERQAIAEVGGEMKYTNDPKLATTEIIDYIKNKLDVKTILLGIDRDGTLIEETDFPGKNENWKGEIKLKDNIINLLSYFQTKYKTTKIVVSNQAGVARQYFNCEKVEEINNYINDLLAKKGIKIDDWQYCPDVDIEYATLKQDEIEFDENFVKEKTKRKPSSQMLLDGLKDLEKDISDFSHVIILGDRQEDSELAENLRAVYIDANKSFEEALKKIDAEFNS
jgi:rfaE bifunctional protein nucleotidyltransferase chain/domain